MMWFGVLGLLFMLIPLAYLLASLVGLSYLWYRVFKGKSGGDLPTCAKCGYAVRGLMGLDCPECGADLREVGIITPKQRGAVSPVLFVLLWTLLLPGPGCLVSGLLIAVGPKTSVPNHMLTLMPTTSGQYVSTEITHFVMPTMIGLSSTSLHVQGNGNQFESMEIDPVAMTYEDWSSVTSTTTSQHMTVNTGSATRPLDQQAVLDMLHRAGADVTRQHVIDEADELLSIIRGIPTQGLANLNPTRFSQTYFNHSYDQPAGWFILLMLCIWLIVWVGGLVCFFRIRRKYVPGRRSGRSDKPRFAPPSPPPPSAPSF